jgi:bis(5'-adenosyl)-triphosphatase
MAIATNKCPFCSPLVEVASFAESENFRAVYNLAPILPGHILILPKKHHNSFIDVPENRITEMVIFSRRVIRVLQEVFNAKAFDWTIQDGKAAGQTIDHFHLHIIPRSEGDPLKPGEWYPEIKNKETELSDSFQREKLSSAEMKIIVNKLKKFF